jgi:hypothetical protein
MRFSDCGVLAITSSTRINGIYAGVCPANEGARIHKGVRLVKERLTVTCHSGSAANRPSRLLLEPELNHADNEINDSSHMRLLSGAVGSDEPHGSRQISNGGKQANQLLFPVTRNAGQARDAQPSPDASCDTGQRPGTVIDMITRHIGLQPGAEIADPVVLKHDDGKTAQPGKIRGFANPGDHLMAGVDALF